MIKILLGITTVSMLLLANTPEIIDLSQFKSLPILNSKNLTIKNVKQVDSKWYYLQAVAKTQGKIKKVGIFTDKNTVVIGRGFDVKSGKEIKFDIDYDKIKENAAYTIGTGKDEYFVFTDLECPYCKTFDRKIPLLHKKAKFYVFFYPLSFHLASKAMSAYIYSLPFENRAKISEKLFNEPLYKSLKIIDHYNIDMYQKITGMIKDPRGSKNARRYVKEINKAFKISLKTEDEIIAFCQKKIKELSSQNNIETIKTAVTLFEKATKATKIDFEISGTPSIFDSNEKNIQNPNHLFLKYNIVNFEKIKELSETNFAIKIGNGEKDLYIFTSTQCPHCITQFKDEKRISELLKKYKVHFFLIPSGGNPSKAYEQLSYLYSIPSNKQFGELSRLMKGGELTQEQKKEIKKDKIFFSELQKYLRGTNDTFVTSTPTAIDGSGKIITLK